MSDLVVTDGLDARGLGEVSRLFDHLRKASGAEPVDEQRWKMVAEARAGGDVVSVIIRSADEPWPVAYAQATRESGAWAIDVAVAPKAIDGTHERVLRAVVDAVRSRGGGDVVVWMVDPSRAHVDAVTALGLEPQRELLQLRVPLPLAETTDLVTRPFIVGQDEERWLELNNAAFAWHPEQGSWTRSELEGRIEEPWFDPDGFLLHERDGALAGFCWTKEHSSTIPPIGEIYVIAVHPDHHGHGLGRSLTVAGLAHLAKTVKTGMLYVEADNIAAVKLYERLGFVHAHSNRSFVGSVVET